MSSSDTHTTPTVPPVPVADDAAGAGVRVKEWIEHIRRNGEAWSETILPTPSRDDANTNGQDANNRLFTEGVVFTTPPLAPAASSCSRTPTTKAAGDEDKNNGSE